MSEPFRRPDDLEDQLEDLPQLAAMHELSQQRFQRPPPRRRWLASAAALGVIAALALGFGTNLFETGPVQANVDAAYRDGVAEGLAATEADWAAQIERRAEAAFERGRDGGSLPAQFADWFEFGVNYEAAYEAILSLSRDALREAYHNGWDRGYREAYGRIKALDASDGGPP